MPWRILDHVSAVKPCDFRRGIGRDATLEEQPFAIVLLSDGGLLRESRRDAVNLSASGVRSTPRSTVFVFYPAIYRLANARVVIILYSDSCRTRT